MRKINSIFFIILFLLSGCSSNTPTLNENTNPKEINDGNKGIWAGKIVPHLETTVMSDKSVNIKFTIKNQTEMVKELVFPSSKRYDYLILDEKNNEIYRFSKDKVFSQSLTIIKLAQAEEMSFEAVSPKLKKGKYTVEFWLVAKSNKLKSSKVFNVD